MDKTNIAASKFLGKKTGGSPTYDPSLLVAIPREHNRKQYQIDSTVLPFTGYDIWHAYEFSALTQNGIPFTRLLKVKIPCENEFIIESKSLKLYLNSFNMTRFGHNIEHSIQICKEIIKKDLDKKLNTNIELNFVDNNSERICIFNQYKNIMDFADEKLLYADKFKESPELLEIELSEKEREYFYTFDSLRSNCRVTHQPDFGDVFIYYKSKKRITEESLVKYLISFRAEFHFHEECCEIIYKRLYDLLDKNDNLMVCALYTRRGGIDICPMRWSKNFEPHGTEDFLNTLKYARYGVKQ